MPLATMDKQKILWRETPISEFEVAKNSLEEHKLNASNSLQELGKYRLIVESELMSRFVSIIQKVNQMNYHAIVVDDSDNGVEHPALIEIEKNSYKAIDLLKDGVGATSSGVLVE